jgi:inner membrane protein
VDTLTHALSGALLARATAPDPARSRVATGARVLAGAAAAAFPDVDFVLAYVSPVAYLTGHRGVTHSILLLPAWAFLLAWCFSKIDRSGRTAWRDWIGVSALALGAHIVGDLITSFGTMIWAPVSDARVAWGTTFIIDLWFSGIILAGLAASAVWRRSRVPAVLGLAVLAGYVGLQAFAHSRALDFGAEHARRSGWQSAVVSAVPRPVSPFNWMVMVREGDRYHYANVNLVRDAAPPDTGGFISRLDAAYLPPAQARWTAVEKYGAEPAGREFAAAVLADRKLDFFRWFADYPALYRIDRGNPSTCVWFQDLRFTIPGRDANIFRYGLCREEGAGEREWRAFRLLDDGTREPAG